MNFRPEELSLSPQDEMLHSYLGFSHNNWENFSVKKVPKDFAWRWVSHIEGGLDTRGALGVEFDMSGLGTPSSGFPRLFHLGPCGERLRSAALPDPSDWPLPVPFSLSLSSSLCPIPWLLLITRQTESRGEKY